MTDPTPTPPPFIPYVPGPARYAEPLPPMGPPTASLPPVSPAPWTTGAMPVQGYPLPSTPRTSRAGLIIALVVGAIVLVAGGAAGAVVLTSDKSPVDAVKAAAGPQHYRVTGTLTLSDGYSGSGGCSGQGGYKDIGEGASVTVSDSAGATIAIDRLGPGVVLSGACVFSFSVDNVPAGKGFYGVEVSHRGVLKFSESEISTQSLTMSLG